MDITKTKEVFDPLFIAWKEETNGRSFIRWHELKSYAPLIEFVRKNRDACLRIMFERHLLMFPEFAADLIYSIGIKNLPVMRYRYDRKKPKYVCRLCEWAIEHGHNTSHVRFALSCMRKLARNERLEKQEKRRLHAMREHIPVPNLFELGTLTEERFRSLLNGLHEDSMFCSFSWMWRKKLLFKLLLKWSHHNKGMCLQVLFEEIDSCGWQALDLIDQLIDRKQYIVHEKNFNPNRYHAKILCLYRWAMGHGYGTARVREAYHELKTKLAFKREMHQVVNRLDRRREKKSITDQDWNRAKASFQRIARRDPERFFKTSLHEHLLWRGFNTDSPDGQLVSLLSDIMATIVEPPRRLADAKTPADIYHAWYQGDPKEEQPEEKTAEAAALEN